MNFEVRFNDWKRKLLDLGKRNGLINYKQNSKSVLGINQPSIREIWDAFVEDENEIEFPYISSSNDTTETENDKQDFEYGAIISGRYQRSDSKKKKTIFPLSVNKNPIEAQRTLRNLRKKNKTFVEEQDVNVLYLSFCFLEWTEKNASKQTFVSPLILVPVSLQCNSINSPMILKITDDEIVINPTLSYKLSHDFGIELPEFQDEDFETIYKKLKDIAIANDWTLKDDVNLSILSFLKINMYKDFEKNKETILNHPVVRALCGDSKLLEKTDMQNILGIEDFDHDSLTPNEIYNVVDSDSSQQDAVLCASRGVSFVLQGPPGTGKSQTITNIIASKIAEGKKVLFVSEKKAALDVVYKRLQDVGLADFCLLLHSNKTNKKETLLQLEKILTLSKNKANISDSIQYKFDKLMSNRKQLNSYAKELNESISPLNKSIFYANGEISKFIDMENVSFQIDKVRKTTEQRFREYISVLEEISDLIEKMKDDFSSNPWRNTTVRYMTHEFIHDFSELKEKICLCIEEFTSIFDELSKEYKLKMIHHLDETASLIDLLEVAKDSPIIPEDWIEESNLTTLKKLIDKFINLKDNYTKLITSVLTSIKNYKDLNTTCYFEIDGISNSDECEKMLSEIEEVISSNPCFNALRNDVDNFGFIARNETCVKEYLQLDHDIFNLYKKDILSIDIDSFEIKFKKKYSTIFRVFSRNYWDDLKYIREFLLDPTAKKSNRSIAVDIKNIAKRNNLLVKIKDQKSKMLSMFPFSYKELETDFVEINNEVNKYVEINNIVEKVSQIKILLKGFEDQQDSIKATTKERYAGIDTDWIEINNAVNWIEKFKKAVSVYDENFELTEPFVLSTCSDANFKKFIYESYEKLVNNISIYKDLLSKLCEKFDKSEKITSLSFENLNERVVACGEDFDALQNWIDYRIKREEVNKLGLSEYMNMIEEKLIPSANIIPIFKKRFYRLWIDSVLPEYPTVANFRHRIHEDLIKEFSDLDREQFLIAQARIKAFLINSLPDFDLFTKGEVNILKKELIKQRKIMPLRKLFSKIPNLLLMLKPCLMMSPLSVSQFLESDSFQFDTVIFDEASQVKTETALGAIFRGKQIIIAGDSHQLPPTNFFNVQATEGDFDSDDDEDNECLDSSILDEALFLPSRELLWHYRSRHEHLIAFSNSQIYKNRLVTFPSNVEKISDWGVEYIYVEDGVYYGKGKGNPIEAERVAQEVFEHIEKYPNRTLGVITFGIAQELVIESAINKLRKLHPECEEFFAEDRHEAFFVKSLENVQGDERDTIIFSIGYAKDSTGKMAMRFGPLSMVGGERRLNVAITRAKFNIKLVGSILPSDINVDRVSQNGPKLLRKYINFAINGPEVIINEEGESEQLDFDSQFETSVLDFLTSQGFEVVPQVGCAGYRIDLGIKHPENSGVFVLGIECDGASYYSSRTARERDRLRRDVLEMMGWNIYRIWSTDWVKDTENEKQRLLQVIENSISTFSFADDNEASYDEEEYESIDDLIQLEDKESEIQSNYGFAPYKICKVSGTIPENADAVRKLVPYVKKVVEVEFPIHFDILCERVCVVLNKSKGSAIVQRMVKEAVKMARRELAVKDDFVYMAKKQNAFNVRESGSRQINQISIDELTMGMVKVIENNIGLTKDDLLHETATAFGYGRKVSSIIERLTLVMNNLARSKFIEIKNEKIIKL